MKFKVSTNTSASINATISDTATASITLSNNTLDIKGLKVGSTTLSLNSNGDSDHSPPPESRYNVDVQNAPTDPTSIQNILKSKQAQNTYDVGKLFPIDIHGTVGSLRIDGTYYASILGFDHNKELEGNNTIHFQLPYNEDSTGLAFVDSNYAKTGSSTGFRMNLSVTTDGGWSGSYMCKTIMPMMFNSLDSRWRLVIVSAPKYRNNVGGTVDDPSYITKCSDYAWLLSPCELLEANRAYYVNSGTKNLQKQYDYYKNGNSKLRYRYNNVVNEAWWWGACPSYMDTSNGKASSFTGFYVGSVSKSMADFSCGISPCFSISA